VQHAPHAIRRIASLPWRCSRSRSTRSMAGTSA
jgi:hypothetical protein